MGHWLCFWTVGLANTGLTSRLLHLLPALAGFFVAIFLAWISAMKGRKTSSESTTKPSLTTRLVSRLLRKRTKGIVSYAPVWFMAVFALGLVVGRVLPHAPHPVFYGLRVMKVLPPDSMMLVSKETGPFRADICPDNHLEKYDPRAGYILCRLKYTDKGCMDISSDKDGFTWVKDKNESTVVVGENETFKPWPDCHIDDFVAQGGQ